MPRKKTHLVTGKEATVSRFEPERLRSKKRDVLRHMHRRTRAETRAGFNPFLNFYQFRIADLLFPGLFIKVSSARTAKDASLETYSEFVETSKEFQDFLKEFYPTGNRAVFEVRIGNRYYRFPIKLRNHPHFLKVQEFAKKIVPKLQKAGIHANLHPANVGERPDGSFVFFEISEIDTEKLTSYAKSLPEKIPQQKQKKRKLLRLIERYNKHDTVEIK